MVEYYFQNESMEFVKIIPSDHTLIKNNTLSFKYRNAYIDKNIFENDRIMCIKNKDIEYLDSENILRSKRVYNGDIFLVKRIVITDHDIIYGLENTSDNKFISISSRFINLFELAYAMTIHKSQGNAWDNVYVILIQRGHLFKNLLYTAISRTKKKCIIIADNYTLEKNTFLKDREEKFTGLQNK